MNFSCPGIFINNILLWSRMQWGKPKLHHMDSFWIQSRQYRVNLTLRCGRELPVERERERERGRHTHTHASTPLYPSHSRTPNLHTQKSLSFVRHSARGNTVSQSFYFISCYLLSAHLFLEAIGTNGVRWSYYLGEGWEVFMSRKKMACHNNCKIMVYLVRNLYPIKDLWKTYKDLSCYNIIQFAMHLFLECYVSNGVRLLP